MMTVGWREWVSLPELGIPTIKAKVDSGARTSCLHAYDAEPYTENGAQRIRFKLHPLQKRDDILRMCDAELIGQRNVTDSGGHKELRYVIRTLLTLGSESWSIEMTLKDRGNMKFRMLLGRSAMKGRITVHPSMSFLQGKMLPEQLKKFYE